MDDAHWADEGTLNLLEEAAFGLSKAPVMILCTCRPELAERRPEFGRAARNNTQLELLPLDDPAATRLAELLLPEDRRAIAGRIAERRRRQPVLHRGGLAGHPRGARGGGGPSACRTRCRRRSPLASTSSPRTRSGRSSTPRCSVTLSRRARSAELLGEDPSDLLWALRRKALVEERTTSDAGSYAFRHQLIRDVAYGSLPRADRANLHEQAAAALMAREPFAERAELVAYHLDHAFELQPTPERRNAACTALAEAAASAVRRGAAARGQELYEQAAELSEGASQVEWLMAAADVALRRWRGDHAMRLYTEVGGRPRAWGIRAPPPATRGRSRSARG